MRKNVDMSGESADGKRRKRKAKAPQAGAPIAESGAAEIPVVPPLTDKRGSTYRAEYARQAKAACKLGASNTDLAALFDKSRRTIDNWLVQYPSFAKAVKLGRKMADGRVTGSLYQRAMGYDYEAEEIKVVEGQVVRVPVMKHVPPDPVCLQFWLTNREPDRWRNRQEVAVSDGAEGLAERMRQIKAKRAKGAEKKK
jgi:hypothetical protein